MSHISTYKGDDQLASFKNELKKDRFTLVVFSKTHEKDDSDQLKDIQEQLKKTFSSNGKDDFASQIFDYIGDQYKQEGRLTNIMFSFFGDGSVIFINTKNYPVLSKHYKIDTSKSISSRFLNSNGGKKKTNIKEDSMGIINSLLNSNLINFSKWFFCLERVEEIQPFFIY